MTRSFVALVFATTLAARASAQSTPSAQVTGQVTNADYDRAAKFLAQNVGGLVVGGTSSS
jgi:hypothetical protein